MAVENEPQNNGQQDTFEPLDSIDVYGLTEAQLVQLNHYQQVERPWWDQQAENLRRMEAEDEK